VCVVCMYVGVALAFFYAQIEIYGRKSKKKKKWNKPDQVENLPWRLQTLEYLV